MLDTPLSAALAACALASMLIWLYRWEIRLLCGESYLGTNFFRADTPRWGIIFEKLRKIKMLPIRSQMEKYILKVEFKPVA